MCPGLDLVLNPIPSHFHVFSMYTIPSYPDHELHSLWDPFFQHGNRQSSASHLKNNDKKNDFYCPNLNGSFCPLLPFSTELGIV